MSKYTELLAAHIASISYDSLPEAVVLEAKKRVLDVIGISIASIPTEQGKRIREYCRDKGSEGSSSIWGTTDKIDEQWATIANAAAVFHMELDDVHRTSHTHPSVTTIPPAIALAEELGASGKDLITAIVAGYESEVRIGKAVSPSIYTDKGVIAPGILGAFGSMAAAANLKNLNAKQIASLLGTISYLTPLGIFEGFRQGSTIKEIIFGWGAALGIQAVDFELNGFHGPASALEAQFGFVPVMANKWDYSRIEEGMGQEWEILNTGIKPYACCRQHHAAIDAAFELRAKGVKPEDISSIVNYTFSVASRGGIKRPATIAEAKYSAPYVIAVALYEGKVEEMQFTMGKIQDEKLLSLAQKIETVADPEIDALYDEKWPSRLEVTTVTGEKIVVYVELPKGEPEFPMTTLEAKEKFLSLTVGVVGKEKANRIFEKVMDLENTSNIKEFTKILDLT
ncbi:MAG: MmgE/PrpD family protein [Desulfitobacterium hafniense]|nr:MmgE/PrpD family protein [Desulfitobacterium hafniense]